MAEKGRWTIEGDDLVYCGPVICNGAPSNLTLRHPVSMYPELAAKVRAMARRDAPRPRSWSDLSDWEKLFAPASLDW